MVLQSLGQGHYRLKLTVATSSRSGNGVFKCGLQGSCAAADEDGTTSHQGLWVAAYFATCLCTVVELGAVKPEVFSTRPL